MDYKERQIKQWATKRKNGTDVGWNKGQKGLCSDETIRKMRKSATGIHRKEANGMWQGGITLLGFQIRNSVRYSKWRSDIFSRDNYICQKCGATRCKIEAHHIKMFSLIIRENAIKSLEGAELCEELWNINNGITLCKKCHKEENGIQMKDNKYAIKLAQITPLKYNR